ncbi:MAG: PadR family transcriptional regulator [Candidatus Aminicenantes bacterium]|nr:PadR family transcriptional regulator [Candidatus Aminicenantes bacterium]
MFQRHRYGYWTRGERLFHKGDFKYLILDLLKEKPRHGYEIIRDLEEKTGGFYAPSPGAVYPTLQWLEEMGFVTVEAKEGKKIYTITEAGQNFLAEKDKEASEIRSQMKNWWGGWSAEFRDEMHDVMRLLGELGRTIGQKARQTGKEKLPQVKEAIQNAAKEVERIFKS